MTRNLQNTNERAERTAQIAANPSRHPIRAAAIVKGRQRLAKVTENRNPGLKLLSTLRLAAGLSKAELAMATNLTQADIIRLEKNPGDASPSTLKKLAEVLGVEMAEVVTVVDAGKEATKQAGRQAGKLGYDQQCLKVATLTSL